MTQIAANPMESWFLNHSSKLPIFNIDDQIILQLPPLKYQRSLGVIVKLLNTIGYTEIVISQNPLPVFIYQNLEQNQKLNIQQVVNLVIPEFERGIVPTVSELQELLEEALEQLQKSSEATIIF